MAHAFELAAAAHIASHAEVGLARDDVMIGDDVAVGVDDEAGSESGRRLDEHDGFADPLNVGLHGQQRRVDYRAENPARLLEQGNRVKRTKARIHSGARGKLCAGRSAQGNGPWELSTRHLAVASAAA